ncbi:MAG: membrane protein [Acidimicrobiia bacterium]|nr:MAG: membrane protein [Acidimicrobiia bacterium]
MADATPAGDLRYMPALDGLRAAAVVAVLLYHADVPWAAGGYLGVDAFFVLSGFLITSLLLAEHDRTGRIDLAAFWARRARRLLPALALVVAAVAAYAAFVARPVELPGLRADALATLGYAANWHQILSEQSYFEQYASPSPLRHTWSLAIEEQFYLLWPLFVLGVLRLRRGSVRALGVACGVLAAASAVWMAVLYEPGADPSRVYYGTDTRVQSLAVGALLATVAARRGPVRGRAGSLVLHGGALAAAAVLAAAWATTSDRDPWQYRGGFALTAVLVALVIASATQPVRPGPLARALSVRPLRWVGTISYGLYLWHWPVYVLLDEARTGLRGPALLALRLAVTFAVATASFALVEQPIRRGAGSPRAVRVALPAGATALVAAVVVATAGAVPPAFRDVEASELRPPEAVAARRDARVAAPAPEPRRVMVVGDSVADSLAPGLERYAPDHDLLVWNAAVPGCGIATDVGDRWFAEWRGVEPRCLPGWRERWPAQLAEFRPEVVVGLFGAQDAFDRRIDGRVVRFDTPEGEALARAELGEALDVLSSTGARVLLLTTPYYRLGWPQRVEVERSPLHEPWVDRWNAIVRDVASKRVAVRVLDLNAFLNPAGTWTDTIDGIKVRSYDRSHLSPLGARVVAKWLLPEIERALADRHATRPTPLAAGVAR